MIPTPVADIIRITGAMVHGLPADLLVSADIEVDSRLVVPGGLFVALPGRCGAGDGHDDSAAEVRAGAVAAIDTRFAVLEYGARRSGLKQRPDGVTVVDDAGSADPTSMRAALRTLAVMGAGKRRARWPCSVR